MVKDEIIEHLKYTERDGIDQLITYMDGNGFFTAPCSGQYHLSEEGGLAEHSLNVENIMFQMAIGVGYTAPWAKDGDLTEIDKSIVIVSLLHDLGKMGQFGKANYIPNMVKSRKKNEDVIQSTAKPFKTNPELLAVPHEIRSIQTANKFIELTEEENFAILYHNGMYGDLKYQLSGKERPLQMLLHFADMWASRVIEKED